ncbi:MAG: orotate phosphoribosyltransferase, partial [Flavobacteriales bacterium]|nr:orotate phosphoribosyltransferase [Flavobacteriales bacterium]
YSTLLPIAKEQQYVEESDLSVLNEWRDNPAIWKK